MVLRCVCWLFKVGVNILRLDIVGQVGIGNMKRSEVCGVYERELVVLNGKMMEIIGGLI